MQNWCEPHMCGEAYWIAYYYYFILFFLLFFPNICDYIKEGPVLLLLFPSLSLSPLIGPWSMCLLFCFVCFEWMLCCDVVCEKKKKS